MISNETLGLLPSFTRSYYPVPQILSQVSINFGHQKLSLGGTQMFQIHLQTNLPILAKGQTGMQPGKLAVGKALKSIFSIKCVSPLLSYPQSSWSLLQSLLDLQFLLKGSKKDSFRSFLYFAELNCFLQLCESHLIMCQHCKQLFGRPRAEHQLAI